MNPAAPLSAVQLSMAGAVPLRILLVDDDEVDRAAVRRLLHAAALHVSIQECEDAQSALDLLGREPFDCLLFDFQLPKEDGLQLLQAARALGVQTPVVMLTGRDDVSTAVQLMKSGAYDYLPKRELTGDGLRQSILHALRLHQAEQEKNSALLALQKSEEFNRRILEASDDCIQVLDTAGQLLMTSPGGLRSLKIQDPIALQGTDWLEVWSASERPLAAAALDSARGGERGRFVGFCPARDGTPKWWDVVVTAILDARGKVDRLLATSRDISHQKRQEDFEKQLIGIVSHDLRNPLNAINLSTEVLLRREELDESTLKVLHRVKLSADRAARMIRDLLDFTQARTEGGIPVQLTAADVHEIAADVVDEVRNAHPDRTIEFVMDGPGAASCDPDRLAQALTNLLVNAVSYSTAGSVLRCAVVGTTTDIRISVSNEGEPIPPEKLPFIFEPMQRATSLTDRTKRSIGLGLYIVKHIVQAHHGSVSVASTREAGTCFQVYLPRTLPATGTAA